MMKEMEEEEEINDKKFFWKFGKDVEKIREKILLGDFWGKCGAVSIQKQILNFYRAYCRWDKKYYGGGTPSIFPVQLFSMASSTYYAASGNAVSLADGIPFLVTVYFRIFWLWRAWRCLRKAEIFSDKFAALRRMEDMSLGELDTRACILNKRGRRNEALALISHGITKISTGQTGTKHNLCLFLIHEAEVIAGMRKYDKENKAETNYKQAMKLSEDEGDEIIPVLTKVRVMKSYGKFLATKGQSNDAEAVLSEALDLARSSGLFDQVKKIKTVIKSLGFIIR